MDRPELTRRRLLKAGLAVGLVWALEPARPGFGAAAGAPADPARAERFMRRAIELSRRGMEAGDGGPFGAVVVRGDEIVGEGWNRVVAGKDPTAHAEMEAIRTACRRLDRFSLAGCELFASAQPCPMCFGAVYWARLDRIYYANSVDDAAAIGFDDRFIYEQLRLPFARRKVPEARLLAEEARKVFTDYAARRDRVPY